MPPSDKLSELRLSDAFVPRLQAGEYTLTARQTFVVQTESSAEKSFDASKTFWVRGPRFSLAPDEIQSRYPADGHRGDFEQTLPHVVFRRKALPWERPVDPDDPPDPESAPEPWIALLLLEEGDLPDPPFHSCSLDDVITPQDNTSLRGPAITLAPGEKGSTTCTVLDIQARFLPRREALRYLAHARKVGTGDKEDDKDDMPGKTDRWFSVVMANRLPAKEKRSVAVLVSLEGFGDLIEDDARLQDPGTMVRLVVLDHWQFISTGETFDKRIERLHKDKDPWLRASDGSDTGGIVGDALALGYLPLPHALRDGSSTASWYRGPLVPTVLQTDSHPAIFETADEALNYDPDTGVMDASYAAAWQLGRMLALQSPDFATALYQYGSGGIAERVLDTAEGRFSSLFGTGSDAQPSLQRARQMLQDDLLIALALEGGGLGQDAADRSLFDAIDIGLLRSDIAKRPAAPPSVTAFLGRLSLLHGVPFNYLVADEKLLPPESLKFFHVDPQWITALIGGALSVGRVETVGFLLNKAQAGTYITNEITYEARQQRARQKGVETPLPEADQPAAADTRLGSFTGFLLRSSILEAWPGLEVRALRPTTGDRRGEAAALLRLDRVAPGILFGLVDGPAGALEITQPPEGLHFDLGTDADRGFVDKDTRVLDVKAAAKADVSSDDTAGSARFAANRIASQHRFIFSIDG